MYRDHRHHEDHEVDGVPTHTKLRFLNGTTPELVLTCSYDEDDVLTPIHLTEEGYDTYEVAFEPVVTGLSATAAIDPVDDSVVRVVFVIECASAAAEDVETSFSVLASRGTGATLRTDCILRGALEIEEAPLPAVVLVVQA
jgi:hypothetical protein